MSCDVCKVQRAWRQHTTVLSSSPHSESFTPTRLGHRVPYHQASGRDQGQHACHQHTTESSICSHSDVVTLMRSHHIREHHTVPLSATLSYVIHPVPPSILQTELQLATDLTGPTQHRRLHHKQVATLQVLRHWPQGCQRNPSLCTFAHWNPHPYSKHNVQQTTTHWLTAAPTAATTPTKYTALQPLWFSFAILRRHAWSS